MLPSTLGPPENETVTAYVSDVLYVSGRPEIEAVTEELVSVPWQLHPVSLTPDMPDGSEVTAGTTTMAIASKANKASLREAEFLVV